MDMSEQPHIISAVEKPVLLHSAKYPVPDAAKGKVALLSDFTLLVWESYKADHAVLAYQQLLARYDIRFTVRLVPVEEVRAALDGADVRAGARRADISDVQVKAINLIKEAVRLDATDIHILNYQDKSIVKLRIHGLLFVHREIDPEEGQILCRCMYGSMCDVGDGNYNDRLSQDARLSRETIKSAGLNGARISTRPMEYGNLFELRLLYGSSKRRRNLKELGYNARQIAAINQMIRRKGVNIFSGVTGSGKSTALQVVLSMLLTLHGGRINLMTVEQPLEYVIDGAVQTPLLCDLDDEVQVAREWARSIANLMRLDPDYLMVGELRDLASTMAAIQAAMTGHGMWTTTHAKDAFATFDRLADLAVPIRRLTDASLFTGVVNQSLAPVLCPACKRSFSKYKDDVADDLRERIKRFCVPSGVYIAGNDPKCPTCGGLGIVDRTVVAEAVLTSQSLLNVYRKDDGGSSAARSYWVKEMGGMTKCQHLIQKINEGIVDPFMGEEAVCSLDEDSLIIQ
ncbi:Flp pilus assembly complex ATPase component TadA (plasmid) [Paraburkholderia sprentiae WSM5005]|uniref:Flp pilus assembly complex ATPase component TadA n=1 Tax=Paraburkholderia sprentiae WSM5005 TaxID=754502 RepID=A0ACA8AX41_9BURK|nr:ATPase, T2SS/T4P/T4SS family [Paraburkholderia sprentiae]APA90233.1 Flp pilus assembly complex ATPase component TadA [Paraburkholderia sprentiae WSM5005]